MQLSTFKKYKSVQSFLLIWLFFLPFNIVYISIILNN